MSIFDWFADRRKSAFPEPQYPEREIPDGLWYKCESCDALSYIKDLETNFMVCPECQHHVQVTAAQRLSHLIDGDTWIEINGHLRSCDPLEFSDRKSYKERLIESEKSTGLGDAIVTGFGNLEGITIGLGIMDFRFMAGSMGSVVGEKITRLIEAATTRRSPVVLICASGGARMQEGILSLMQMAKTSAALDHHRQAHLLYIPILTYPTTGGVTASFAMLGDIILAEPKALIGFTGRRVIEQTLKQKIPDDFQTSEYLLSHGQVDAVVPRSQLKSTLAKIFSIHGVAKSIHPPAHTNPESEEPAAGAKVVSEIP